MNRADRIATRKPMGLSRKWNKQAKKAQNKQSRAAFNTGLRVAARRQPR